MRAIICLGENLIHLSVCYLLTKAVSEAAPPESKLRGKEKFPSEFVKTQKLSVTSLQFVNLWGPKVLLAWQPAPSLNKHTLNIHFRHVFQLRQLFCWHGQLSQSKPARQQLEYTHPTLHNNLLGAQLPLRAPSCSMQHNKRCRALNHHPLWRCRGLWEKKNKHQKKERKKKH